MIDLCEQWSKATSKQLIEEYSIVPLRGMFGVRLSVEHRLKNGEKHIPVISESGELQFASGWPQIRVISYKDVLQESREYQVRAIDVESGDELQSKWFEKEEDAEALQAEIENEEEYTSISIIKRIKELGDEEETEVTLKSKEQKNE